MKTLVFKLDRLSTTNLIKIDEWLRALRWVWNEGLRSLEELDMFTSSITEVSGVDIKEPVTTTLEAVNYTPQKKIKIAGTEYETATITWLVKGKEKRVKAAVMPSLDHLEPLSFKSKYPLLLTKIDNDLEVTEIERILTSFRAPCCPVPWQYRRIDKNKPWGDGNLAPYTYWARKKPYAQFCRLPQDYRQPRIDSASYFSLAKYFAHKRHPDKEWLKQVPSGFIRGTCHSLAESWQRYKSGKGGKPKFKSARDVNDTLVNEDAKNIAITRASDRDGFIRIPKLGVFRVKHLWRDFGDRPASVLRVAKRSDGYYLQLTGQFDTQVVKDSVKTCTITAPKGISALLGEHETGKIVEAYRPDQKLLRRKELLQQQLSRQAQGGSNWKKTKRKIGRLEKQIADGAKAYNQKLSTFLVRTYGEITLSGVGRRKVLRKPKRKERAKTLDPIHFDPNGAEAIALYNRHVSSQRVGQFVALVKQKGKVCGRDVKVVNS
ncbi:MAG: transposase [Cyanobacteria bacterium P01_D01_bin.36]